MPICIVIAFKLFLVDRCAWMHWKYELIISHQAHRVNSQLYFLINHWNVRSLCQMFVKKSHPPAWMVHYKSDHELVFSGFRPKMSASYTRTLSSEEGCQYVLRCMVNQSYCLSLSHLVSAPSLWPEISGSSGLDFALGQVPWGECERPDDDGWCGRWNRLRQRGVGEW